MIFLNLQNYRTSEAKSEIFESSESSKGMEFDILIDILQYRICRHPPAAYKS